MPLLAGETPSQLGHFPILRERRDKELTKPQSGEDSWYHHICKYPFPLPGEPSSSPAKPGDWDHIIWASCSGESPPRSMSLQSAKQPPVCILRDEWMGPLMFSMEEGPEASTGATSSPGDPSCQGPSHLFIPICGSLRQKPAPGKLPSATIPLCQEEYLGSIQNYSPVYLLLVSVARWLRPWCWSLWLKSMGLFMSSEITMCLYTWLEWRLKLTAGSQKLWVTRSHLAFLCEQSTCVCFLACHIRRMTIAFIWWLLANGPKGLFWSDENSVEAGLAWKRQEDI